MSIPKWWSLLLGLVFLVMLLILVAVQQTSTENEVVMDNSQPSDNSEVDNHTVEMDDAALIAVKTDNAALMARSVIAGSAGGGHTCALKEDNSIVCWGRNYEGQSTPPAGNNFTQVSNGGWHTCALTKDNRLVCWGSNELGQSTPPAGNDFTQLSSGEEHTCALKKDNSLVCW